MNIDATELYNCLFIEWSRWIEESLAVGSEEMLNGFESEVACLCQQLAAPLPALSLLLNVACH
jgi:hypothetical protein